MELPAARDSGFLASTMPVQSLYHTYKRYRTLQTDRITALPIVLLMPHSACNCRCVMCDIWKGNDHLQQLTEEDVEDLIHSLKKLGTRQVVFSGGEALLHPNFFRFCELLKKEGMKITLLSTGITLKKNAALLVQWVDELIVSLDGDEPTHNTIRNIPGAFQKLADGIAAVKRIDPSFRITGRTVIHRLNFYKWPEIISSAKKIGLSQISFLPADVSSHAFNRDTLWDASRQQEIIPGEIELAAFKIIMDHLFLDNREDFVSRFIAEPPAKIEMIYRHYAAYYGLTDFPYKKCNAPWVSAVVEADGTVRPCFFHEPYGNIKKDSLEKIINSERAIVFRKQLDINNNDTCVKCTCYLNLSPRTNL